MGLHAARPARPPASGSAHRRRARRRRAALFGLKLTNPARARPSKVMVDAHSELMTQYPWGFDGTVPNASRERARQRRLRRRRLVFRTPGSCGRAAPHDYAALVGSDREPRRRDRRPATTARGPGRRCAAEPAPHASGCDDGPFGKGTGGQLRYSVDVPAHGSRPCGSPSAGSENCPAEARREFADALTRPGRPARREEAPRRALARLDQVSPPGRPAAAGLDRLGQAEPRRPHAGREGRRHPLDRPGQGVPPPRAPSAARAGSAPASPTTRGCSPSTASTPRSRPSRSASSARSRTTCARCATSPTSLNDRSGKVAHEVVADGSVWSTAPHQSDAPADFNTDEMVKFPSAVALIWRWTGDDALPRRDVRLPVRDLRTSSTSSTRTATAGPRATATSSAPGMGEEKLDNTVYYIRGLYDLADMARPRATARPRVGTQQRARSAPPLRGRLVVSPATTSSTPTRSTTRAT